MASNKRNSKADSKQKGDEKSNNKFLHISKGKVECDDRFAQRNSYQIYEDASGNQYSCYLMKADVQNNNNKFYLIQLLQNKANLSQVSVYTRYGRVGETGVSDSKSFDIAGGIKEYEKLFKQKTGASKGYLAIEMKAQKKQEQVEEKSNGNYAPSTLPIQVQKLIEMIYNKDMMTKLMVSQGYDPAKLPLGELSDDTIKEGYGCLKEIEDLINSKGAKKTQQLQELSSKFFTYIPHNFGRQNMSNFTIDTVEKLKAKLDLIQSLVGVNTAFKAAAKRKVGQKRANLEPNPIDQNYDALKCKITSLDKENKNYKMIENYIKNTGYGCHDKILDIFELDREGEAKQFNPNKYGNNQLLWHGSRVTNFCGILSQGLRIAPPEAPMQGYAYGKGVYFSAQYQVSKGYSSYGLTPSREGLILLCQVALGNEYNGSNGSTSSNYVLENIKTVQSTAPGGGRAHKTEEIKLNGVKVTVPCGELLPTGKSTWANIVYNTNQINMKYLVKVQM